MQFALLPALATEPPFALGPAQNWLPYCVLGVWLKAAYFYVSLCCLPNPKMPTKIQASFFFKFNLKAK